MFLLQEINGREYLLNSFEELCDLENYLDDLGIHYFITEVSF